MAATLFGQLFQMVAIWALARSGVRDAWTLGVVAPASLLLGFTFFLWGALRFYRARARRAAESVVSILFADDRLAILGAGGALEILYDSIDAVWLFGAPGGPLQALVVRDRGGAPHAAPGGGVSWDEAAQALRDRAGPTLVGRLRLVLDAGREVPFRLRQRGAILTHAGVRAAGAPPSDEVPWSSVIEIREEPGAVRVLGGGREIELPCEAENFVFFTAIARDLAFTKRG